MRVRGFDSPPVAFEARRPAAPESQPVYSAETASETLAGAPSAGIKTTRDGSSSASGKVGGAGGGESARGRARRGTATGEGPTLGADGRHVVVVVVGGGGDVFVVERRGVRVGGSGAGDEVPRDDLGRASLLAGHGLGRRALERGERGGIVEVEGRARHGRERDGIDARERRGRRRVSRGSLGEENGHLRIAGSIAVVVARVDGGDRVPGPQEERLAVATDGVAHHREARGRLGRVSAHLCRRDRGSEVRPFDFSARLACGHLSAGELAALASSSSFRCSPNSRDFPPSSCVSSLLFVHDSPLAPCQVVVKIRPLAKTLKTANNFPDWIFIRSADLDSSALVRRSDVSLRRQRKVDSDTADGTTFADASSIGRERARRTAGHAPRRRIKRTTSEARGHLASVRTHGLPSPFSRRRLGVEKRKEDKALVAEITVSAAALAP